MDKGRASVCLQGKRFQQLGGRRGGFGERLCSKREREKCVRAKYKEMGSGVTDRERKKERLLPWQKHRDEGEEGDTRLHGVQRSKGGIRGESTDMTRTLQSVTV